MLISIQILRAIAALLVVGHHAFNILHVKSIMEFTAEGARWIDVGIFGVHLFFVISGLIIYLSVYRDGRTQPVERFVAARLMRIVPLYWLVTTCLFGILYFMPGLFFTPRENLVTNYVYSLLFFGSHRSAGDYAPLLTPGWTLNFEMLFYAAFTLYLLLRQLFSRQVVLPAILLFSVGLSMLLSSTGNVFYSSNSIVLEFVMGLLLARYFYPYLQSARVQRYGGWLLPLGVAWFVLTWGTGFWQERVTSWGISAMLMVAGMLSLEPWLNPRRWCRALGEVGHWSYSIYLLHTFLVYGLLKLLLLADLFSPALYLALVFGLSLVVGAIGYYGFEKPVLGLKRYFLK